MVFTSKLEDFLCKYDVLVFGLIYIFTEFDIIELLPILLSTQEVEFILSIIMFVALSP